MYVGFSMLKNNRGAVQSAVVVVVAVITMAVLAVVISQFVRGQIARRNIDKKLAQEVAEYGMMLALNKISEMPDWKEGFVNTKYPKDGGGYYSVEIGRINDSTSVAKSTGAANSVKVVISCKYRLEKVDGIIKPRTLNWEYN